VLPALWLLLAPTKTAAELVNDSPLAFGSFRQRDPCLQHLTGFQNGVLFTWLRNSAVYAVGALILTCSPASRPAMPWP